MALTSIIVKGLALADAFLGYFAYAIPAGQTNICGTGWVTYNAGLTACGDAYILAELMEDVFELHMHVVDGLFAALQTA